MNKVEWYLLISNHHSWTDIVILVETMLITPERQGYDENDREFKQ